MHGCLDEDDLLALARGGLDGAPDLEGHLADCPSCSALLATLLAAPEGEEGEDGEETDGWGSLVGRSLGPYRLDAQIGAGAAGDVYRAWDARLSRHVAIKVLSPRVASSPEGIRRMEIEARSAASIAHPNVVAVYDVGSLEGAPFIVSELCEGESLRSLIDRGALSRGRAIDLGIQLARGLAAAHEKGVVHRDLKPGNLIVSRDGTLKILDFGLAKRAVPPEEDPDATRPGTVLGTAGYLSPEQARGEPADARSDLFAAGEILYEMLTGERAFDGASFADRLSAVLRDTPRRLDERSLGDLLPAVARCLEKAPEKRFQSALDLAWVLEARRDGAAAPVHVRSPKILSRRALLAAAAAVSGVGLGALLGRAFFADFADRASQAGLAYQQLTYRQGVIAHARFTPDGGSVVYAAAWDDQPLAVFAAHLGGGGTRALELPSADVLSVSSRGQLALCVDRRYVRGMHTSGRLALVPLAGGEPRVLAEEIQEADFTPDGRELAIIRRVGTKFRLEMPLGHALLETDGWPSHARVSPSGDRVACLLHPSPEDDRGDVLIVDRRGGQRVVSKGWSSVAGLGWAPDGRALWFTAAKEGSNNALRRASLDGHEEFLAETTGRLRLHDIGRDGVAALTHDTWRVRMMVRPPGAIGEVDMSLSDASLAGDFSADGATLIFGEAGDVEEDSGGYVRAMSGGRARKLGPGHPFHLSADGRHVLSATLVSPARLFVCPTEAGEPLEVPVGPIELIHWAQWRNEEQVIVAGSARGAPSRLWRVNVRGGAAVPLLLEEEVSCAFRVSPGGAEAVFIAEDGRLLVVALEGSGAAREVPGRYRGEQVVGFSSSSSSGGERGGVGAEIFVRTTVIPVLVRRVDLRTGASRPEVELTPPALGRKGVDFVAMSASGGAYAYSYGQELSRLYAARARG